MMNDYGVVVIARDEERNMADCLSALVNTCSIDIFVIVDSRTVDKTADVARKYTSHVLVEEGSRGRLRNVGYKVLGLPFVAYVDADMRVEPGYFEALRRAMDKDPKLAFAAGAQIPMGCCRLGALDCEYLNYKRAVAAGGSMYRVKAVREVGGFNERLNVGEDGELAPRLFAAGWKKKWVGNVAFGHFYAPSKDVWRNKMTHGHAAGFKMRGLLRVLASPVIGLHAAIARKQPHMLWYVPLRSLTLLTGSGAKKEYIPMS